MHQLAAEPIARLLGYPVFFSDRFYTVTEAQFGEQALAYERGLVYNAQQMRPEFNSGAELTWYMQNPNLASLEEIAQHPLAVKSYLEQWPLIERLGIDPKSFSLIESSGDIVGVQLTLPSFGSCFREELPLIIGQKALEYKLNPNLIISQAERHLSARYKLA